MKICTYTHTSSFGYSKRLGILAILEDTQIIIDPNFVWACDYERDGRYNYMERAYHKCPPSLHAILNLHDNPIHLLEESYGLFLFLKMVGDLKMKNGTPVFYELDQNIRLHCPLDKITSYRDFYAHEKHVKVGFEKRGEKIPDEWYQIPAYYKGSTTGFIGHDDPILWPNYTNILDYELELAMIIGRDGKNIKKSDAFEHIFGYTILNDISARDIQRKEMAVRLGPAKAKDFCSIMGPVIVTSDEFHHKEPNLLMRARVNGKEWSKGYSGDSYYSWADMIHHVSQDEWILPGDVFGSGTVGTGCGLEIDRWIKPGDKIELEIEKIGILKNQVGFKQDQFKKEKRYGNRKK